MPGEGIYNTAGGGIINLDMLGVGIPFDGVIALERDIEAVKDFMQPNIFIYLRDASLFVGIILVEVGLDSDHLVVVADTEGTCPRMVSTAYVYIFISKTYSYHNGRYQYVAGTRHREAMSVYIIFKSCKAFYPYAIICAYCHLIVGRWQVELFHML